MGTSKATSYGLAASIALAMLAGCSGSTGVPPAASSSEASFNGLETGTSTPNELQRRAVGAQHLYVSLAKAGVVLRFPLLNGIPAKAPDAHIGGFTKPLGLAQDPQGRLYVVDAGLDTVLVYAPKPGTGAKPIRSIPIGHHAGVGTVAVDPLGNLYVSWSVPCGSGIVCSYATVYRPFRSHFRPYTSMDFFGNFPPASVRSIVINAKQTLIDEEGTWGPAFWANAPSNSQAYNIFCGASAPSGVAWGPGKTVYESDLGDPNHPVPQVVVIPDYTNNQNCPAFYTITSATVPLSAPFALIASGSYIYVSSARNAQVGSALIFVFDPTKKGRQKPVALLGGKASQLTDQPYALAIGP
jgi:hypothetical protein